MRRGEISNLTWDDVDFERSVIRIQSKNDWKPKSGPRIIPLNSVVLSAIKSRRENSDGRYVFQHKGMKPNEGDLRLKLCTLSKRVGYPHITRVHAMRHTFATRLLNSGVDVPTVQALLGHSSWNTTMIYSHQTEVHTRAAIAKLSEDSNRRLSMIFTSSQYE